MFMTIRRRLARWIAPPAEGVTLDDVSAYQLRDTGGWYVEAHTGGFLGPFDSPTVDPPEGDTLGLPDPPPPQRHADGSGCAFHGHQWCTRNGQPDSARCLVCGEEGPF